MIEPNKTHPEYDFDLEVLCTLSTRPVPLSLLAKDFDYKSQEPVRAALGRLSKKWPVIFCNSDTPGVGRVAYLDAADLMALELAKGAANGYWRTVNGSPRNKDIYAHGMPPK